MAAFDMAAFQFSIPDACELARIPRSQVRALLRTAPIGCTNERGRQMFCFMDLVRFAVVARLAERGFAELETADAIAMDAVAAAIPFLRRDAEGRSRVDGVPMLVVGMTEQGPASELCSAPVEITPREPIVVVPVGAIAADLLVAVCRFWGLPIEQKAA